MHIKPQLVLPAGTKITRVPASDGKGKSVWTLLRAEERKLEREASVKAIADQVTEYIRAGYSVDQAIKLASK